MGAEVEMQGYSCWHHYSDYHHQPPLVLPRRGDAGYSGSVKDLEMQVTPVLSRLGDAGYSESDKPLTTRQSSVSVPPLRGRLGGG